MKNTVLLLLLLLCACSVGLNAQEYYIKTVNVLESDSDNGLDILAEDDGYVIRAGVLFLGSTISGVGIVKTDFDGNKLWENTAHFYPYEAGTNNLIKLPNSNYLITGSRIEEGLSFQDLYTIVSPNGNIVRNVTYGDALDNRARRSLFYNNKIVSSTNFGETGLNNHSLLITMDTTCNMVLRQDTLEDVLGYTFNGSEEIILLPTNEYVLGIGAQNEANKIYGYIRKTDTIGTTLWERKINDTAIAAPILHLATLKDGNFVVNWAQAPSEGTEGRGSIFIRCYNAAGDSLWQYTFLSIDYGRNIQDLHVCANGDIIGTGYTGNFSITGNPTCWLFRLSPQGELRWLREYVYWEAAAKVMLLYALTEDPNGDIVATGFAGVYNEQGNVDGQAVLLKVNSMGCFGAGGCNDTAIVSSTVTGIEASPQPPPKEGGLFPAPFPPPSEGARGRLMVFPNPANEQVAVLTPYQWLPHKSVLQVHDVLGRLVATIAVLPNSSDFTTIDVSTLPNGIYLISLTADGVRLAQAKMVVQH